MSCSRGQPIVIVHPDRNAPRAVQRMLPNAIHHAPLDRAGDHDRKDLARDCDFVIDDRRAVRLRWACNAGYLAITAG